MRISVYLGASIILALASRPSVRAADADMFSPVDVDWTGTYSFKRPAGESSATEVRRKVFVRLLMARSEGEPNSVWLFHSDDSSGVNSFLAFRGRFEFERDPRDKENLIIRAAFSKKYQGREVAYPREVDWTLDTRYLPEGGELHLPLGDDVLRRKKHLLTLVRPFYVDEQGKELSRKENPHSVIERVSGRGAAKQLREADFLQTGTVLRLEPKVTIGEEVFIASPPPGLIARSK